MLISYVRTVAVAREVGGKLILLTAPHPGVGSNIKGFPFSKAPLLEFRAASSTASTAVDDTAEKSQRAYFVHKGVLLFT